MKSNYPIELLEQWTLALNVFNPFKERINYLISFGSYHNKDFYYLTIDKTIYFISDFEFSIILSEFEMQDSKLIDNINHAVSKYNKEYSKFHLGHNLNVKISTLSNFTESADNYKYFKNALIKTGIILHSKINIFDLIGNDCEKISPEDITYIFHQLVNYSLLHLDSRFVKKQNLFNTYILHDINKTCLKIITLLSVFYNHLYVFKQI